MGFVGQVDRVAVAGSSCTLGQRTILVAGHKQVMDIVANRLRNINRADGLRRIAGTAEADKQRGLGAGQVCLRRCNEIGRAIGLYLVIQLAGQRREQCVANKLAGAGTGQDHVKILTGDYLIDKLLQLILMLLDLRAGLFPGCRLLIDLIERKGGHGLLHLIRSDIKNLVHFLFLLSGPPCVFHSHGRS